MLRFSLVILSLLPALAWAQSEKPPGIEIPRGAKPAPVPGYFMLTMTDPGCDPEEDCDDVGPKKTYRNWYIEQTGCNMGGVGFSWNECDKSGSSETEPKYDFSGIKISERDAKMKFKIAHIGSGGTKWIKDPSQGIGPAWAEEESFKFETNAEGKKVVSERYWERFEHFVEAACRYVRDKYNITIFTTGGNERDLTARETYQDFYPDWHFYYMAPITHIHAAMKRAHPDNQLMIGNMCYSDQAHVNALYQAGAKDNFEILAIHNYGKMGVHLDMYQIMESHYALEKFGDGHLGIVLVEGWSCFPLPDRIDKDPILRKGARVYTAEDAEHYRQTVLDGWRNIMTPRKDEYDPKWVIGAHYFVLNDHWGGRGWEKRATKELDEKGNLKGFHLDGYWMGTSDPNWIKPFLRPWGLIDINAQPKGDIVFNFPPYLPKHDFEITIEEPISNKTVAAGHEYPLTVKFTNREDSPMSDFKMEMIGRDDPARTVQYRFVSGDETTTIAPGQTLTRRYTALYPIGLIGAESHPARGFADAHYTWKGRPYHTDAWMPRVDIVQPLSLKLGEGKRTAANPTGVAQFEVLAANTVGAPMPVHLRVEAPPELRVDPAETDVIAPASGEVQAPFRVHLNNPEKTGIYELKVHIGGGVSPLAVLVAFPKGEGNKTTGIGLKNASFEDVDADSGYAFWTGEKTNWIDNEEASSLPDGGKRTYGAATDWREFDYTISQTVPLPDGSAGKKLKATAWFIGRGWDAEATGADVSAFLSLVLLDKAGKELSNEKGPEETGTGQWRQIEFRSSLIPAEAAQVRLDLRLASHKPRGCRRGALDRVDLVLD